MSTPANNSIDAWELIAKLLSASSNNSPKKIENGNSSLNCVENNQIELRNLETWHDEDEKSIDEKFYVELADPSNPNGWSADEMFKYNEKMHNINSDYTEKTLAHEYNTPLTGPKSVRRAAQLAKEIEKKVMEEGRVTPESSDDDELFEAERRIRMKQHRAQSRLHELQQQQKHLNQSKNAQRQQSNLHRFSTQQPTLVNNVATQKTNSKPIPQYCNFPKSIQKQLLTSRTLNHAEVKTVTSSSRNILRSCLV